MTEPTGPRITLWCRDYGGLKGLTCGYWARYGKSIDAHLLKHHRGDYEVYDIRREFEP